MNIKKMKDFIYDTPTAQICMRNLCEALEKKGFVEFFESEQWERPNEKIKGIFVVRDSSIIAIKLPSSLRAFSGVLTHSDSPCFRIKRNPEVKTNGYTKLNVEPYGGAIYYSWLDKPLSICGEAVIGDECFVIDLGEDYQVVIPSQAIHINREVNTANKLNPQTDMCPIFSLSDGDTGKSFVQFVKETLEAEDNGIYAMDLFLYNPEPVKTVNLAGGNNQTLIMGPRLDNLASVYTAFQAFVSAPKLNEFAQVFVAFNSEEIGSATNGGADGNFLSSVLERLCILYHIDKYTAFAKSVMFSVDAAHAIHPNTPEKSDPSNIVKLGNGIVIKHNDNYASDLGLESVVRYSCEQEGIKCQDFYSRSDMRCGATLGNISMSHHGIRTLDIGIPMLAMHSAVETICEEDVISLENLLKYIYKSEYTITRK